MDRLVIEKEQVRDFIQHAQVSLGLNIKELGILCGVSGRTIRDWKRSKYYPPKDVMVKLSQLSNVSLPRYKILPQYWFAKAAGKKGGDKTYSLYGLLGTYESRAKGGVMSWYKRKKDPEFLMKYTNTFYKPEFCADLAEFIGIMLGDGGLTVKQCTIYLNSDTDLEYAHYVKRLIKRLFGLTPSLYKSRKEKVVKVSISGINLIKYLTLRGLRVGNKVSMQVGVPDWVWLRPEYVKACIRGLMDTDGCFAVHKYKIRNKEYRYPKVVFTNRSEPILEFMYRALVELGFTAKRTFVFQVWLHNHNEVKRYIREIGTRNYKPALRDIVFGGVA